MTTEPTEEAETEEIAPEVTLQYSKDDVDEHGFTSVWNVASATCEGDQARTREMAGRMLGFLCKKEYEHVVVSSTDAQYLDEWFEREKAILYNWKADSETTDAITQHAQVPAASMISFLKREKFKPTANYSPRRADRVAWFQEKWGVG
ncbi:hypothetical protein [Allorhodopirellula heiligendammensis]|uniref:Uncharacterized protein n=1 Tax=Allorhodopirellula heiligendammensis TaxID=2714739 RepID=A0A5C6BXF1_9BACT|nr:hypothetical protein [Allorhodopirellula heiligendammensis]TWU16645.1 hypothetical protein Poly21_38500 [Allorhodopirellula heiligendammensis]